MLSFFLVALISSPVLTLAALENHLSKRASLLGKVNAVTGNLVVVISAMSFYSNGLFLIVFRVSIPRVEIVIQHWIPIFRSVTESFGFFKKNSDF